jgi:hypothetical protein
MQHLGCALHLEIQAQNVAQAANNDQSKRFSMRVAVQHIKRTLSFGFGWASLFLFLFLS